ncbi:hypothetical protein SO802_010457 [Lithocarpus litseifolius]|uniref:Reverse transcriptase domain-containing protein n=1 Tax=Lithocarpus litseifolius TaxID=425828 RepID=A0AAW2DEA1_9ROSI
MEYLAHLIQHEVDLQHWKGIKTSRDGPTFIHLFIADDLILFAKVSKRNSTTIKNTLEKFCFVSGQKINFSKSRIFFSPHTSPSKISQVENDLCISSCRDFGKYLGVPIITDQRSSRAYNFLINKLRSMLANSLSLAGRMILINSVIPTHVMQCHLLPAKICNVMDKLNRNFLWGNSSTKKKLHLLKWQTVTKPKLLGGLGIKESGHRNKVLLAKRVWDLRENSNSLHACLFSSKYPPNSSQSKCRSTSWSSLCKAKTLCDKGTRWLICNGTQIKFWLDNWTGFGPL